MPIVKIGKVIAGSVLILGVTIVASFATHATEGSSAGIQGYGAESSLQNGTIVQMQDSKKGVVKAASQSDAKNVLGVTVDRQQLRVTISSGGGENEVFVATSGTHRALVSTQGGPISAGDYVALSSINGVAMKASTEQKTVFGRAAGSFDGKSAPLGTAQLKDVDGKPTQTVSLGSIPVTIDIRNNPNDKSTKANVPEVLERIGQAIAEKEVSPIRIYLSLAIAILSVTAVIIMLYSGVKNGVISIGRNPMSKKSILRALAEVTLTSLVILTIGIFAVYLLLKL